MLQEYGGLYRIAAVILFIAAFTSSFKIANAGKLDDLGSWGSNFKFIIVADSHVMPMHSSDPVAMLYNSNLRAVVSEANEMLHSTPFMILNGDIVERPLPEHYAAFKEIMSQYRGLPILVHGNHDGLYPAAAFFDTQKKFNGNNSASLSFDVGDWHFITFPARELIRPEDEHRLLFRLDNELRKHADKPTMVFLHFHLLPVGLTQLEYYSYNPPYRKKLVDTITRYGNVRYVFSGHVHNGLLASQKSSWTYKNTNFVIAPTGVNPRNFGEEMPGFEDGQSKGGYYLVVEVEGDKARVFGRRVNQEKSYEFPSTFKAYSEDIDPRSFVLRSRLQPSDTFENGDFENGLDGWQKPYRYIADSNPGFEWIVSDDIKRSGGKSACLKVSAKNSSWAYDETTEIYKVSSLRRGSSPVLDASYYIEKTPVYGGGFVRVHLYSKTELKFLGLLYWGEEEEKLFFHLPRIIAFDDTGKSAFSYYLRNLGAQRTAFFKKLPANPGLWHKLRLDLRSIYDKAAGKTGAFDSQNIDKAIVVAGVIVGARDGAVSSAYFDDIWLKNLSGVNGSYIDDAPFTVTPEVFQTKIGASYPLR